MEYYIHGEDNLIRRQKFSTLRGLKILFDTKIDKNGYAKATDLKLCLQPYRINRHP